ncbi:MAG: tetratricopeptide repeat-containing glycosyltransferase family protein [Azospirillaceae bacterium]|nr:tetratricopeptide repeat-containing glycosyltransferase family protein [Azospirillaceae bacterium]
MINPPSQTRAPGLNPDADADRERDWRAAIAAAPDQFGFWLGLTRVLAERQAWSRALRPCAIAVRLAPQALQPILLQATLLELAGKVGEAGEACQRALHLAPGHAGLHAQRGRLALQGGDATTARRHLSLALALDPDRAEFQSDLARASTGAAAVIAWTRASRLDPSSVIALTNRGIAQADRPDRAAQCCRAALCLDPAAAPALNGLGNALKQQGRYTDSLTCHRRALILRPDFATAQVNLGMTLALCGNLPTGLALMEARWRVAGFVRPAPPPLPLWTGDALAGRTLLLVAEQGLGDTMCFSRFIAPLAAPGTPGGGRVLLACQAPLVGLLSRLPGLAGVIPHGAPLPACDCWLPLTTLPALLGLGVAAIPRPTPLTVDPRRLGAWQARLGLPMAPDRRTVGLVWAGSPAHSSDRARSVTLSRLAPLFAIPGIRWLSLQKGAAAAALTRLDRPGADIHDLDPGLDDFEDTAAVLSCVDLLISVDTAVAHLAGILGRPPVWLLLPFVPDWRWLLDRDDSPWYPTFRLFRQTRPDDWEGVATRVAQALARDRRPEPQQ